MNKRIVLSVAMPTHNRSQYALQAIESILSIDADDLQLVVSDTSTDGKLEAILKSDRKTLFADGRLKYNRVLEKSDMTDNYNRALRDCDGEYICVIGDDDTITSYSVNAARWAADNNVGIISQTISANYAWPDFRSSTFGMGHAGRLYVPRSIGRFGRRDSHADLLQAVRSGLQGPIGLPLCYHGLVHRSVYLQAQLQTGEFFHGSSPDISGAVAIAKLSEYYIETDFPLTIPGAGGASNTGRAAMKDHKGDFESEAQTIKFVESGWLLAVPRFFSAETIWAHAGLSTLLKLDPAMADEFGYERLIALCQYRFPEYHVQIDRAVAEYCSLRNVDVSDVRVVIKKIVFNEKLKRLRYMIGRATWPTASGGRKFFGKVKNVFDARLVLESYLTKLPRTDKIPFI